VSGTVKVADLGLARFNDSLPREPGDPSTLTQAGTIMGTVDYMSPEQALGVSKLDHRTDVYSLGCTLYYLLCGKPPYQGPTVMATLLMHRDTPIPSLSSARPGVPPDLDQLFRRMVAKSPDERFGSLAEVIRGLEAIAPAVESRPARTAPPAAGQAAVATSGPVGGSTVEFQSAGKSVAPGGTVVLVEPSRSQVVIIRGYLQQLGFTDVVNVASGRQALEAVRGAAPRAVISALHLPDMTGAELAQLVAVASASSPPRFVLITSQADAAEASLPGRSANEVRLTKPFTTEQLATALGVATRGAPNSPTGEYGGGRPRLKILLADDSAAARRHARGVLEGLGVGDVTEAVNGAEAVDLLEKGSYDLVVTDYTMPFLDGRGLVEFIRERSSNRSVPVVVVTSETDPAKLAAVRQLGISGIFDKRFQPEAVRAVLDGLR
jgi:two-component system chemotaxis response regulator CheY